MAVRTILKMGHPVLQKRAEPVEDLQAASFKTLLVDMVDTMRDADGAGLAAPQIGESLQVIVFGVEKNPRYPDVEEVPMTVLINPMIEALTDEQEEGWEGCLSVPKMRGLVPRYQAIRYVGLDPHGVMIDRQVSGFHARVVQHEYDHLLGVLYPQRIRDLSRFGFEEALPEFQEKREAEKE